MARILPASPIGAVSKEIHRVYKALRALPDDRYTVWYRLSRHVVSGPDFLVVNDEGRAAFLTVSHATPNDAVHARQPGLFDTLMGRKGGSTPLGEAEQAALVTFQRSFSGPVQASVPALICFPNLPGETLKRAWLARGIAAIGKDQIEQNLTEILTASLSAPLAPQEVDALRAAIAPEVVVPPTLTTRQPPDRNREAGLTDFLLDYDQEAALKLDLDLGAEAPAHVNALQLRLINGVAGSGKSLIILYRARLLHDLFPHKQILVTTHNKALIRDLEGRYHRLGGNGHQTEWRSFAAWCRARLVQAGRWRDPVSSGERSRLIEQVWRERFTGTTITRTRLADELDWYKDQLLFSREEYLQARRRGRGFQLQATMRERMYEAFMAYEQLLGPHRMDWGDVPRRTYLLFREGRLAPPQYDVVLIDEAQFFAPIWFEIIKTVLKPQGHLFMVADPTQGFLKRGQSWLASGLEVRGRSERLARSYRTTRDILEYAVRLYQRRLPGEQEEDIIVPALHEMPRGRAPELLTFSSEQDEVARLVDEIRRFRQAGGNPGHLLVLHPTWEDTRTILQRLRSVFGANAAADPREQQPIAEQTIRVCTLDAATGLEAPIVFVLGLHRLLQTEQDLHLSRDEQAELVRDNTRRLYMACTRAGQRLVLCHVGAPPEALMV